MNRESVCVLETSKNVLTTSYEWKVKNYSDYNFVSQCLISSVFSTVYSDSIVQWRLNLYPNGTQWPYKDYLSIFVEYLSDVRVRARVKIAIVDVERNSAVLQRTMEQEQFQKGLPPCGDHKFVSRSFIKSHLLKDDALTILCTIVVADGTPAVPPRQVNRPSVEPLDKFEHLLETGKFSDVTLAIGEKKFRLHKVILASCSPVFRAMFEHDMKESQSSVVDILDVRHEVMREIVRFMYTNKVHGIDTLAVELLVTADMYSMAELKELCEQTLCRQLSIDSALQSLTLAITYNACTLRAAATDFIIRHLQDFSALSQFKMLDSDIVNELLAAIAKKKIIL